jgi:hypothetical protein
MKKKTASIEEVLAAVEAARDKVMADEVKSLTKLGIPKAMAYQMIASRFHQKVGNQEEASPIRSRATRPLGKRSANRAFLGA